MIVLSILIATVVEREHSFYELLKELNKQIEEHNLNDKVEICYISDNKELTIGSKRNGLLSMARGQYITFLDDDDMINEYYVPIIVKKLEDDQPDCIGFSIRMTTNGENEQICDHSLRHKKEGWQTAKKGFDYIRNVTHFNPIKAHIAKSVGFPEVRYGEDKVYSDAVTKLCFKESYVEGIYMIDYRYSNKQEHKAKYGIK